MAGDGPSTGSVRSTVREAGRHAREVRRAGVTNNSTLPAECAYTAIKTAGLIGPGSVERSISVGPNSTQSISDLLWPPPFVIYSATVTCTATYDGKQITIGESTQDVIG